MASMVELVNSIVIGARLLPGSVEATVTPVGGDPVETEGLWVSPDIVEFPEGAEFQRRDGTRLLAVTAAAVPSAPRKTVVVAPETAEGDDKTWRVETQFDDAANGYRILMLVET